MAVGFLVASVALGARHDVPPHVSGPDSGDLTAFGEKPSEMQKSAENPMSKNPLYDIPLTTWVSAGTVRTLSVNQLNNRYFYDSN